MAESTITPGTYRRYDGRLIHVTLVTRNIDTGEEIILCKDGTNLYAISPASFTAYITYQGATGPKYAALEGEDDSPRIYRNSPDYFSYAKDLCEHFIEDYRKLKLCNDQKRLIISKKEYQAIREDLNFLNACLKTTLSSYNELFKGRFVDGLSIRKYAEVTGINRGSVDYLQKKFFTALAAELRSRDESDGIRRIQ
jgi:hypothetical protein